jgi:hypothetical protein
VPLGTIDGGFSFDGSLPDGGALDGGPDGGGTDGGADGGARDGGGAGFAEPCIDNASCASGICIQSSLGSICSKFCVEDCPLDYGCKVIQIGPNRTASVCFPGADIYCVPCENDDCASPGDRCTDIGGARYCTRDCTANGLCPIGSECVEVHLGDGGFVAPAAADAGASPSDGGAADAGSDADAGAPSEDGGAEDGAAPLPDGGALRQCIPVSRQCPGCRDRDRDGYGIGAGCLGSDCNDDDPAVHPGAPEVCDLRDNNCDGQVDETFDLSTNNDHCGGCNVRCNTAQGFQCCNGQCVQPASDENNCGGCGDPVTGDHVCAPGEICCSGLCTSTDTDIANCGGCSTSANPRACATDGTQLCCGGVCREIKTDDANCGKCGVPATGENICRVVLGEKCCDGVCQNILSSSAHCGGCGGNPRACGTGIEACCMGVCTSIVDNDLACGACGNNCTVLPGGNCCGTACYDKLNDPDHCGDACITCTGGTRPACCGGDCTDLDSDPRHCGACQSSTSNCRAGESCCGGLCKNLQDDEQNCGQCGNRCGAGETCCDGRCVNLSSDPNNCGPSCQTRTVCAPGTTCCTGLCVNLNNNPSNCGRCGNVCNTGVGEQCCSGLCKNTRNGDVSNCGSCGFVCDLPNTTTHACVSSACQVSTCDPSWFNVDGTHPNGCECNQGLYEPNNSSSNPPFLGEFSDVAPSSVNFVTRVVPWSGSAGFDVDWFRFRANDGTNFGTDSFHVRVTLSGLPSGNNYRLTVYRGPPPGSTSIGGSLCCCGFLCFGDCSDEVARSRSATSNGASSVTVEGWDDPSGLGGGCDDTHDFWVSIEQLTGVGYCGDLILTIRNG